MATTESMNDERGAFRQAWDRLTAGNIDDPTSEAAMRYKNADGSMRDTRKSDTEMAEEVAPAPVEVAAPTDADVPVDKTDSTATQFDVLKAQQAGAEDEYKEAWNDENMASRMPVANEVKPKAPVKAAPAKPAAPKAPEPMLDKVVDKPAPAKKGFSYADAQAAYDASNPDEVDEVEELDKPNAFGAKYSMPKSLAEQIKMIWQGKDYKPSGKVKVKARPVVASAVDAIPK